MKVLSTAALVVALFPLAVAESTPAPAPKVLSTETLRSFCSSTDSGLRRLCSIYILGVVQGISIGASPDTNTKVKCIRDALNEADLVKGFMEISDALKIAYPADMTAPAVSIVGVAIASKFPCSASTSSNRKR